jgi:hypothetical protein
VKSPPRVLPAGADLLDRDPVEIPRELLDVGRELQLALDLALLEPGGKSLEPVRARLLRALGGNTKRDALQRNALFSFSKKPSSAR